MNKTLLVILLSLIPLAGLLLHPALPGFDTYNYLSFICNGYTINPLNLIEKAIFSVLPCNFLILKLFLWLLQAISLFAIIKIGELFYKNKGWIIGLLVFLSPIWFLEFSTLENDQIAYPIIFIGLYFALKHFQTKKGTDFLISTAYFLIASQIWLGTGVMLLGLIPLEFWFFTTGIILIIWQWTQVTGIFAYTGAIENQFGLGFLWFGPLIIGFFNKKWHLIFPSLFLGIIITFNAKYSLLIVPFLAMGFYEFWQWIKKFNPNYFENLAKYFFPILIIGLLIGAIFSISTRSPTNNEINLIKQFNEYKPSIRIEPNKPQILPQHKNDWGLGYQIQFFGGTPSAWGGGKWSEDYNNSIALVYSNLNCNLINQTGQIKFYDCSTSH